VSLPAASQHVGSPVTGGQIPLVTAQRVLDKLLDQVLEYSGPRGGVAA